MKVKITAILSIILLAAITMSAVCAIDSNATDDAVGLEDSQDDEEPVQEEPPVVQPSFRVAGIFWGETEDEAYSLFEEPVIFWQDGVYSYYMDVNILESANVIYEDGSYESVTEALSNGHIGIYDLDMYGVPYYAE